YDFDSYLLYVEWNREPDKKFYPPRRKQLKPIVDALQELADDKLDLLAVSLPLGCGKTTLAIFYLTWLGGKIQTNLGCRESYNTFLFYFTVFICMAHIKIASIFFTYLRANAT
ncbi:MAG: hypothetical protein RSG57_01100, partial [Christensenellaceae bacterium]